MRRMNDAELIERLGGPAKVCELLGYDKDNGGVQRVCNWVTRGIPSKVKVERPDLFMPELVRAESAAAEASKAA
jgi:hypothetical protein